MNMLVTGVAAAVAVPTPAAPALADISTRPDDSMLLALADKYILAERRYGDALVARDRLLEDRPPPPEVLRVRPRDLEMGKTLFDPTDEFWHRPCDIGQWKNLLTYQTEYSDTPERLSIVTLTIQPPEDLRQRGTEIVSAYEAWCGPESKKPRGWKKAKLEAKRAEREYWRLEQAVAETPATTIEGMLAKIRCAEAWEREEIIESINGGCAEAMAVSIFADIRRMAAGRSA